MSAVKSLKDSQVYLNYRHNQAVQQGRIEGKIVPKRRINPEEGSTGAEDFTACMHCYALIPKVNLLKHLATCKNLEKKYYNEKVECCAKTTSHDESSISLN